jgi:hypothetical protein
MYLSCDPSANIGGWQVWWMNLGTIGKSKNDFMDAFYKLAKFNWFIETELEKLRKSGCYPTNFQIRVDGGATQLILIQLKSTHSIQWCTTHYPEPVHQKCTIKHTDTVTSNIHGTVEQYVGWIRVAEQSQKFMKWHGKARWLQNCNSKLAVWISGPDFCHSKAGFWVVQILTFSKHFTINHTQCVVFTLENLNKLRRGRI